MPSGVLPCGPHTLSDCSLCLTGPGNPHHQQLPALRGHPGESPAPFSAAHPHAPLPAGQASFWPREGATSEPHTPHQVPANSRLQILPGDEIVQINEQVVVSEGRGRAGRKEGPA